jgi:hypothetical protein
VRGPLRGHFPSLPANGAPHPPPQGRTRPIPSRPTHSLRAPPLVTAPRPPLRRLQVPAPTPHRPLRRRLLLRSRSPGRRDRRRRPCPRGSDQTGSAAQRMAGVPWRQSAALLEQPGPPGTGGSPGSDLGGSSRQPSRRLRKRTCGPTPSSPILLPHGGEGAPALGVEGWKPSSKRPLPVQSGRLEGVLAPSPPAGGRGPV